MFGIDDAIAAVSGLADTVIKRVWPDATQVERDKIKQVTQQIENEYKLLLGQIETNKIEAKSSRLFIAGWRPLVGWSCGFSLLYASIIEPIARFIAVVFYGYSGTFPILNTDLTLQILLALLGIAGMRTFEKHKGITK